MLLTRQNSMPRYAQHERTIFLKTRSVRPELYRRVNGVFGSQPDRIRSYRFFVHASLRILSALLMLNTPQMQKRAM